MTLRKSAILAVFLVGLFAPVSLPAEEAPAAWRLRDRAFHGEDKNWQQKDKDPEVRWRQNDRSFFSRDDQWQRTADPAFMDRDREWIRREGIL
ncbi:hypothetical protein LZ24_01784 [Desulfobotulus alkaliphilus]|uniref:Uncharacterized protein n=1 Tax=Desulfobotulus alkaliphilus TaxID=622671 RepID=A0A562RRS9_9BACT|nr:hypothetical protein [Desulfobotulus alkaliphilus]TWI71768.1 hypothetical protein LZ24_01784 [Desulfobotulus alkaliphilus]